MPQTTLTDTQSPFRFTVTGVPLEDLVESSAPVLPAAKNALLHVVVEVSGVTGTRAVALGELDPAFGNHPALLATAFDGHPVLGGAALVFPGDDGFARTVVDVRDIHVVVASPALPTGVPAGALAVTDGDRTTVLTAAALQALPAVTKTVTFTARTGQETHRETGPTLASVLGAAGDRVRPTTAVAAIGSDGYVATVTPGEATSGGRPLLISTVEDGVPLTQPRLIAVGDVKGGRDDSDLLGLSVIDR